MVLCLKFLSYIKCFKNVVSDVMMCKDGNVMICFVIGSFFLLNSQGRKEVLVHWLPCPSW